MPLSQIETDSLSSALVAPTATALTTASGSAPSYSARAWVNFNGTGTVAIRASGNVSSITDNSAGNYTVNFTTAMVDEKYSAVISIGDGTPGVGDNVGFTRVYQGTTTQQQIATVNTASTAFVDYPRVYVAIFR